MSGHRKDSQPKNVLVVGGAGYIGSHTVQALERAGYLPVILDDLSTGHRYAAQNYPFYHGKASYSGLVSQIIKNHNIDSAMHFSAKALVGESVKDPLLYYQNNVAETVSLIQTLIANEVKNFVFSSTCAVYGEPKEIPIKENTLKDPVNPYGRSKLMVEQILRESHKAYGFHSAILRYFNAAGADPTGAIGEDHQPETHLIPLIIKSTLPGGLPLTIFGKDYPTPDGTCIRDYIHVNDLADAHIRALEHIAKNQCTEDFNLGTGNGFSNLDILHTVEKVIGKKVEYNIGQRREGDPPRLIADSSKAKNVLNWAPKCGLEEIIRTAYNWHSKKANNHGK